MRRDGFSLIEALVALIIVSLVLLALYDLQLQLIRNEARSTRALATAAAQENAVVLLSGVNPMKTASGVFALAGGRALRWYATPLSPAASARTVEGRQGRFTVQLFTVRGEVRDARGALETTVQIERVGWSASAGPASNVPAGSRG